MKVTRFIILLFVSLLYIHTEASTFPKDSIQLDPRWHTLSPSQISDDGNWIIVYQDHGRNSPLNKTWVVHTRTKKKTEISELSKPTFVGGDLLVGKSDSSIVVFNMRSDKEQRRIEDVVHWQVLKQHQAICYQTSDNQLHILSLKSGKERVLFARDNIKNHLISEGENYVLFQTDDEIGTVYSLNIHTLEHHKLTSLSQELKFAVWNHQDDAVALRDEDSSIILIDLRIPKVKTIPLPHPLTEIVGVPNISFFLNNDVFFSYWIKDPSLVDKPDYVEIWRGNARDIHIKSTKGLVQKHFVYQNIPDKLVTLGSRNDKDYFNIYIPKYVVCFNPFEFIKYKDVFENKRYFIEHIETRNRLTELTLTPHLHHKFNLSPNFKSIVYPKGKYWEIYDFETKDKHIIRHTNPDTDPIWSDDSNSLFIQNGNNFQRYYVSTQKADALTNFNDEHSVNIRLINIVSNGKTKYVKLRNRIFYSAFCPEVPYTSIYSYHDGKVLKIRDKTSKRINNRMGLSRLVCPEGKVLVWTEEDFKQPPVLKVARNGKVETLMKSELPEELFNWRKQKIIDFKNKHGKSLRGVLYYPKDFDPKKKYPMISHLYEIQSSLKNLFHIPSFQNQDGYNVGLLSELGYFVFLPDVYVSEEGPGLSALDCVTQSVESALCSEAAIDRNNLGLIGHSFGGYQVNFIVTQTDLFAAAISGAGFADLIWNSYKYNEDLRLPNYSRFEVYQYKLGGSFAEKKELYLQNSPLLYAQNVRTPLLLWTGMKDENVHWENTRQMYFALKRHQIPTVALFYKNVPHSFITLKEQNDLTYRVVDWFDYFLKNKKDKDWIEKSLDYQSY